MIRRLGLLALLSVTFLGCKGTTNDKMLVMINPQQATEIAAGKKSLLNLGGGRRGIYLDPRSEREFLAGHIPGAINMPFGVMLDEHEQLREYGTIIIYGDTYGSNIAKAAAKRLLEHKHDVRVLDGGLRAWEEAGKTIEQGESG